jgi:hypothetical protein
VRELRAGVAESEQLCLPDTSTTDDDEICVDLIGDFEHHADWWTVDERDAWLNAHLPNGLGPRALHQSRDVRV